MNALWNTLWVSIGAAVLATVMGWMVGLAWLGNHSLTRRFLMVACGVTLGLPPFLVANCWLELTAGLRLEWDAAHSATAMLPLTSLVLGAMLWPIPALVAIAAWGRVEVSTLESMPGLRAGGVVRHVLWPATAAGSGVAALLSLFLAASNFTIPTLFQVRVLPEVLWVRFNTQLDVGAAWRQGWPLVAGGILAVALGWNGRLRWPFERESAKPGDWRRSLGWCWGGALAGTGMVLALSLGVPLLRLLNSPRTWAEVIPAVRAGSGALWTSAWVAASVAAVLMAIALLLAQKRSWFGRIGPVAWLWFLTPGILTSSLWVPILARPAFSWVADSALAYGLVLFPRYLALAWSLATVAAGRVDATAVESLRMAGCGPLRSWWLGAWPQMRGLCLAGAYATYLLVLWDVESILLVMPPGMETAAVRVFNLLHYGHAGQVNALCLALLGLAVLPLAVWGIGSRRFLRMGFLASGVLLIAGCSRGDDRESRIPIESRWFSHTQIIGRRGVAPGQFNKPRSLVCDRDDNLYVADVTGRIQKFDPNGRFLLQWQMPQTDLGKAKGMGLDPDGHVLVIEPHYMRVNHFDGSGRLLAQWGKRGTNAGAFILPRDIVVNSRGEYFLSEYTVVDRVQRFGPIRFGSNSVPVEMPRFEVTWGQPGDGPGRFSRAEGLGIGPNDEVYVADSCNHRVQVFDREGRLLRTHGKPGSNAGQFSYPFDIVVDARGNQFLCEFGNSRISVLDAKDQLIEVVGGAGAAPGQFANPWAIAMDSKGNLYVADSQNHRVQKLIRRAGMASAPVSTITRPG
jgi:ABC-type Fe3+ transport system permease subunit/DNA-binding beta-propeller fold protein YncE